MNVVIWAVSGAALAALLLVASLMTTVMIAHRRRRRPVVKQAADGQKWPLTAVNTPWWLVDYYDAVWEDIVAGFYDDDGEEPTEELGLRAQAIIELPREGETL